MRRLAKRQAENNLPKVYYESFAGGADHWGVRFELPPPRPTPGVCALHAVNVHRPLSPETVTYRWLIAEPPDEKIGWPIYLRRVDEPRAKRLREREGRPPFFKARP